MSSSYISGVYDDASIQQIISSLMIHVHTSITIPLCISLLAQPWDWALMLKSRSKRHPLCNRQRSSTSMELVRLRQSTSSECVRLHLSRLLVAGEHFLLVLCLVAVPQQGCFAVEW